MKQTNVVSCYRFVTPLLRCMQHEGRSGLEGDRVNAAKDEHPVVAELSSVTRKFQVSGCGNIAFVCPVARDERFNFRREMSALNSERAVRMQ
jgi:hypothetical protein